MKKIVFLFFMLTLTAAVVFGTEKGSTLVETYDFYPDAQTALKIHVYTGKEQTADFVGTKIIKVLKDGKVIASMETLTPFSDSDVGEGYQWIDFDKNSFTVQQSSGGREVVLFRMTFFYENGTIVLKKYREEMIDRFSEDLKSLYGKFIFEKGIPMDCISDQLVQIFHSAVSFSDEEE